MIIKLGTKKKMYYILKDNWYYRENARGYTANISEAGKFTYDEMKKHLDHCEELASIKV